MNDKGRQKCLELLMGQNLAHSDPDWNGLLIPLPNVTSLTQMHRFTGWCVPRISLSGGVSVLEEAYWPVLLAENS